MIKKLGQKIELFNEYCKSDDRPAQMREAALDVQIELTSFFAFCIRFFRQGIPFGML